MSRKGRCSQICACPPTLDERARCRSFDSAEERFAQDDRFFWICGIALHATAAHWRFALSHPSIERFEGWATRPLGCLLCLRVVVVLVMTMVVVSMSIRPLRLRRIRDCEAEDDSQS